MPLISTLAGSPSANSLSSALLAYARDALEAQQLSTGYIPLRTLDPADLLQARTESLSLQAALGEVAEAQGLIIATPIYKAAYTGLLKTFLDLLPPSALSNKVILPLATGGTLAHLLALDYALKPVLAALGAEHILQTVYFWDQQIDHKSHHDLHFLDLTAKKRFDTALERLAGILRHSSVQLELS